MAGVISRFTIAGTDYDYEADQITVSWQEDRDDYRRLDDQIDVDVRRKLPVIQWQAVMVAANSNADSLSAAGLYSKIEREVEAGNTASFVPDINASAPNSATPSLDIVTRPDGHPKSYAIEQGQDRLTRSFSVQSAKWLDPSDTTAGGDRELIDDLHSLSDPL
jgi:hypothetical protein